MSEHIVNAVTLCNGWKGSQLAGVPSGCLGWLDCVQGVVDQQTNRLLLRHGVRNSSDALATILLLDLSRRYCLVVPTADIVEHCLEMDTSNSHTMAAQVIS